VVVESGKPIESLTRSEIETIQITKLQQLLKEVYGNNSLVTRKMDEAGLKPGDITGLADLKKIPYTYKNELVEQQNSNGFAGNMTYPLSAYTRLHQTSGTTGEPLRVLDTEQSWDWWGTCWREVLRGAGLTNEDRLFCAFSFGPFIGFWATVEGARKLGCLLVPGGGRSSLERLQLMRDTGCTALACTPSYALHLLEVARENNFDIGSLRIRTTVHAGEPGANIPATKKQIEDGWGAKCHDHAGASEVGAFGYESRSRPNGLYVIETEFIAEIMNPETGQPVAPGESGELVLTNLGRPGFPVIRYKIGDLGRAPAETDDRCALIWLEGGVIGRADDMVTVRGVNIYPSAIENLVRQFGQIDEFRATVEMRGRMEKLTVEIEIAEGNDNEQTFSDLLHTMTNKLGLTPEIVMVPPGTLPRFEMKAKRFFVNRD